MSLLNLPDDVLEKILSCMSYDDVSRCRLVCRRMNDVCKRVLNRGFHRVERYHAKCLRQVKSQLPRRESERRKHSLARHCDILTAVETRLSLLGMTFMKFIEMDLCCFIPGKVLDEIYKVLRYVTSEKNPVRAHEVLQELRDLSSMAMEHFDEKISPAFRKRKDAGPKIVTGINIYQPSVSHHPKTSRHNGCEHKPHKWKEEVKNIAQKLSMSRREIQSLKSKVLDGNKSTTELEKKFLEMHSMFTSQLEKFKETDLKIDALTRLVESRIPVTPLLVASKETQTIPLEDDAVRNNTSDKAESEPKKQKPRYQLKGRPAKRLRKN